MQVVQGEPGAKVPAVRCASQLFHTELQADQVRVVDGRMAKLAFQQLTELETELRETGSSMPARPGGTMISASPAPCWRGRHGNPHLSAWVNTAMSARRPRRPRQTYG
jgi:hypothetical protein